MNGEGRATLGAKAESNALGQEVRRYDSREGVGRVESGTETENNAGAIIEKQLPYLCEQTLLPRKMNTTQKLDKSVPYHFLIIRKPDFIMSIFH